MSIAFGRLNAGSNCYRGAMPLNRTASASILAVNPGVHRLSASSGTGARRTASSPGSAPGRRAGAVATHPEEKSDQAEGQCPGGDHGHLLRHEARST